MTNHVCFNCAEYEDSKTTDLTSLENKEFTDERTQPTPELSTDEGEADLQSDVGSEATLFTDKMISGNIARLKTKYVHLNI